MSHRYIITISLIAITIFAVSCAKKTLTGKIAGVTPIATPAQALSGEPNISSSSGNEPLLSWIEKDTTNNTHSLRFSQWENVRLPRKNWHRE